MDIKLIEGLIHSFLILYPVRQHHLLLRIIKKMMVAQQMKHLIHLNRLTHMTLVQLTKVQSPHLQLMRFQIHLLLLIQVNKLKVAQMVEVQVTRPQMKRLVQLMKLTSHLLLYRLTCMKLVQLKKVQSLHLHLM